MIVSNRAYFILWRILLFILIGVLVTDIVFSQINGSLSYYFQNHTPGIIALIGIIVMASIRINYFSYEDEYEIIHIHSKSLIFGSFKAPAQTRYEFPKRIICDYEFKKSIFTKRLTISLVTQHGIKRVRKFNLTFVPMQKLNYVVNSLENIRNQNAEIAKEETLEWS